MTLQGGQCFRMASFPPLFYQLLFLLGVYLSGRARFPAGCHYCPNRYFRHLAGKSCWDELLHMVLFPLHLSHPGYLVYALPLKEWRSQVRILNSWKQRTEKKHEHFLLDLLCFLKNITASAAITMKNTDPTFETMVISLSVSPEITNKPWKKRIMHQK